MAIISVVLVGRGGQGIKSSARIVGTASFLNRSNVQDQPIYGAERRGAPVLAFIRISKGLILDRGPVINPSLLVIADDSLLEEPALNLRQMISKAETALINTNRSVDEIQSKYRIGNLIPISDVSVVDLDKLAEQFLDRPIVGSAVAGVTSRLLGHHFPDLEDAMSLELPHIGITGKAFSDNLALAKKAYNSISIQIGERRAEVAPKDIETFIELSYKGPKASTSTILAPANTEQRRVGMWSRYKPVIDHDECTKCRICFVYCPDSAIFIDKNDLPNVNYNACKGCDICHTECPVNAISLVQRKGSEE